VMPYIIFEQNYARQAVSFTTFVKSFIVQA
jgi:hypothetical protein